MTTHFPTIDICLIPYVFLILHVGDSVNMRFRQNWQSALHNGDSDLKFFYLNR